jgi:hypothetical protein
MKFALVAADLLRTLSEREQDAAYLAANVSGTLMHDKTV